MKSWHRWVTREDLHPTSMMWAVPLPGGNSCFCLKKIYLEGLTQAEGGMKGVCEILGEEATLCRDGWARGGFSACAEAMTPRLCEDEQLHWGCWRKV